MSLIKDLPDSEKPREKAMKYGIKNLSNSELLALIIRNGYRSMSSIELSSKIIQKANGLCNLSKLSFNELKKIKGIKDAKALEIVACIELARRMTLMGVSETKQINNPVLLAKWLNHELGNKKQEMFLVVLLDSMCKFIDYRILFTGTIDKANIYPRDIIAYCIDNNAVNMILVHNHPSNNLIPSNADIDVTQKIILASEMVGIKVLDHLIVSNNDYFSFKEHEII